MTIYGSDSADEAIEKAINEMCQDLVRTSPTDEDFTPLVDGISKLRASLNSPICQEVHE
jgi:hypothetical protein